VIFLLTSESARKQALEALRNVKLGMVVRIEPSNRTNAQNAFYWACLSAISDQIRPGKEHSRDVWHEYFKQLFLPTRMLELPNGELVEQQASTASLNKADFSTYVEQVLQWATERGLTWTDDMNVMRAENAMLQPE
jgi:hypothetical protein